MQYTLEDRLEIMRRFYSFGIRRYDVYRDTQIVRSDANLSLHDAELVIKGELNTSHKICVLGLECSSVGDKRFSAFYADIQIGGINDCIEVFYQLSKRVPGVEAIPLDATYEQKKLYMKSVKGRRDISHIEVYGEKLDKQLLTSWYNYLWYLYFAHNPDLLYYVNLFQFFTDKFGGKSINSQSTVMSECRTHGLEYIRQKGLDVARELARLKGHA